tara:strand:- start:445 stop:792 length:348 start_codon:yes stop_codon:yes gene_type:complete
MSILSERISANRAEKDRKNIEVEEWGEGNSPLLIYYGAVTGRDIDRVQRKHPDFLANPTIAAMVEMIILKAEDDQGEKLFTIEDKQVLLNEPVSLIGNIFGTVFNADSVEEQEKN